jgi:hypothetical protein
MSEGFADMSASLYLTMIEKNPKKFVTFWNDERDLLLERNAQGFRAIDVGSLTMGYRNSNSVKQGKRERIALPSFWAECELLGRSSLHSITGFAEFEGILLAFEADAGERVRSVIVLLHDGGIVVGHGRQVNQLRRNFGENVLALHDADFHVGAGAVPLKFVVAGFQLRPVDGGCVLEVQLSFRCCECAGGEQEG